MLTKDEIMHKIGLNRSKIKSFGVKKLKKILVKKKDIEGLWDK